MKVWTTYEKHSVTNELEATELHCPNCGIKNVKVESNEGDYYVGAQHYCLSCNHQFTIQIGGRINDNVLFTE